MTIAKKDAIPTDDMVIKLRAKLDDDAHTIMEEGGTRFLVCRVRGEKIDMLRALEHLSEFVNKGSLEGVENIVLISDRNVEVLPGSILEPKLEAKEKDDHDLFEELREKLTKDLTPIVFTTENDILELYRTAIRMEGSYQRTDNSIGLDLAKTDIPKEGDVIYLVFDDGYRKMDPRSLNELIDRSVRSLREAIEQPKEGGGQGTRTSAQISSWPLGSAPTPGNDRTEPSPEASASDLTLPKVIAREFSRNMVSLGYRKDAVFSRNDANQFFFIGMNMPAVFFKVLEDEGELSSFLRVLSHRKDALGVLITKEWMPRMEALSYKHGFVYLGSERAHLAHEVLLHILKEGGTR